MDWITTILSIYGLVVTGIFLGSLLKFQKGREGIALLEKQRGKQDEIIAELREQILKAVQEKTIFETKCQGLEEKIHFLQETEAKLTTSFKALSSDALSANSASFLQLVKETFEGFHEKSQGEFNLRQKTLDDLVAPLKVSLNSLDTKLQEVEKNRQGAYEGLKEQIRGLLGAQKDLQKETLNLVQALRTPHVRGRWGEMQLRRVVEMAGMLSHCDFYEQKESVSEEFKKSRPDMIVRLPGDKSVVIDAKVPLMAFLDSLEAQDEGIKKEKLKAHARHVRTHIQLLSQRSYWEQFKQTPEFVVLFLPGESFFSAALDQDPSLIEAGVEQKVILATPTTLISLLRTISYGWRQEAISENAQKIAQLGHELYKRLAEMEKHFNRVGKSLAQASQSYNDTLSRYENRVLKTARQFEALKRVSSLVPKSQGDDSLKLDHGSEDSEENTPTPILVSGA